MTAELHRLSFPGAVLARGFWLYVWTVVTATGDTVLYVGMTGDTSSPNAQSPFGRVSQHLGNNEHAKALRSHLEARGIDPITCSSLHLTAYGPILPEADNMEEHGPRWATIAAPEKALRDELAKAGYKVLNEAKCRKPLDPALWAEVLAAFAQHFPKLKPLTASDAAGEGEDEPHPPFADAEDYLSLISLLHRKLDDAVPTGAKP